MYMYTVDACTGLYGDYLWLLQFAVDHHLQERTSWERELRKEEEENGERGNAEKSLTTLINQEPQLPRPSGLDVNQYVYIGFKRIQD